MSDLELEPASFRDPASTVAYLDGRVLRGLTKEGAADFDTLAAAPFFAKAMDDGKLVRTTEVPVEDLPQSVRGDAWVKALEHERIPFVSYPYEWTFSMLRDAALVHLDLLLAALGRLRVGGAAVVMATHDLGLAHLACDEVCLLNRHQIGFGPIGTTLTPELLRATYGGQALQLRGDGVIVARP
jgi:hypothetical protein